MMESETYFPGEFEGVVVRMPIKITHSAIVNLHIARVYNSGAKALQEINSYKPDSKQYERFSNRIEKAVNTINKFEPVSIVDRVMSQLVNIKASRTVVANFARYLIKEGNSIQTKKTGIAFLGTFGIGRDIPDISELATDEEYTFFAVKALRQLMGEGEEFISKMADIASQTKGWGKIAAILELPDKIQSREVKLFLLSKGTSNIVGKYLLAVECAIKGRLYDYLEKAVSDGSKIEGPMATGICDIFEGMIEAESVKDADSFTEVDGIAKIIRNYCTLYESSLIDCPNARNIYENIKARI